MTPSEVPCLQNGLPARVRPNPEALPSGQISPYGGTFNSSNHQVTPYIDVHWFLMRVRYISVSITVDITSTVVQSRPDSDRIFSDEGSLCFPCYNEDGQIVDCPYGSPATTVQRTIPFTLNAVFIPSGIAILDTEQQGGPSMFSSIPNEVMEAGYTVYVPKEGSKHADAGPIISDAAYYKYYDSEEWNANGYPWDPIPTDFARWWLHRFSPVSPAWAMRTQLDNVGLINLYQNRKYTSNQPYDYPKDAEYLPSGEAYIAVSMTRPVLNDFASPLWPGKKTIGIPQRLYPELISNLYKTTDFSKLCEPLPPVQNQPQRYKDNISTPIVQYFPYGVVDIYEAKKIGQMGKTESFAEAGYYVRFRTDETTMSWEPTYEYFNDDFRPLRCSDLEGNPPVPRPSSIYPPGERQGYTSGSVIRGIINSYDRPYVLKNLDKFFAVDNPISLEGGRLITYRLNEHAPANWPRSLRLYAHIYVEQNPLGTHVVYANLLPDLGPCAFEYKLQPIAITSVSPDPQIDVKVKYRSWNGAFNTDTGAWQL